ncbi:NAD(P)-binding protein [Tothia fuscella]|uniref:NAD(P)-binding protein n=1 Tax=Tothia fuscella TaxID=1048955 RepID=A0A9P4NG46_9PEZI|nr:NAD(P)-binding protein [Tothia fuscella]
MAKPTVLITGCSDDGLGSALALELHAAGHHRVFATARNASKFEKIKTAGIETLLLDVLSEESIEKCVVEVRDLTGGSLDMLVNNAGATYYIPLMDASISEGKRLFDLNVWANLATVQAFVPLLLKSAHGGVIVNHTSIASVMSPPFIALYAASKAAMAMMTNSLRLELSPFGIRVVEIVSGTVKSNINNNEQNPGISKKSLYYSAREWLDQFMRGDSLIATAMPAETWAKSVAATLSQRTVPNKLWVGPYASTVWFASCLPEFVAHAIKRSIGQMDVVEKSIQDYGKDKAIKDAYGDL